MTDNQKFILETALRAQNDSFNEFIEACRDGDKPKAPAVRDLMRARKCIPKTYSAAFK